MSAAYSNQPPREGNHLIDFKEATDGLCQWIFQNCKDPATRAYTYIWRNTAYYRDPAPKEISLDEFVHGRRRAERSGGGRLDAGGGFKDRANARKALTGLVKDGHVAFNDKGDPARLKRHYRLTLPCIMKCSPIDYTEQETEELEVTTVVQQTTPCSPIDYSEGSNRLHGVVQQTTRSVVNPLEKIKEKRLVKADLEEEKKSEGDEGTNPQELENQNTTILPTVTIEKPAPMPPDWSSPQEWQAKGKWAAVLQFLSQDRMISPAAFENWISRTEGWAIRDDDLWVKTSGSGAVYQYKTKFRAAINLAMMQAAPGLNVRYMVPEAIA